MKKGQNSRSDQHCDRHRAVIVKRKSLENSIRLLVAGVLLATVLTFSALSVYIGMKVLDFVTGSAMVFLAGAGSVMVDGDYLNGSPDDANYYQSLRESIAAKVDRIIADKSDQQLPFDLRSMVNLSLVKKVSGRWEYIYDSRQRYGEVAGDYGGVWNLVSGVLGQVSAAQPGFHIKVMYIDGRITAFSPILDSNKKVAGVFIASIDRNIVLFFRPFLVAGVTFIGVAVFIIFILISKHISTRLMKPLDLLEQKIRSLATSGEDRCGDYVVCEDSFREVRRLADATNMVVSRHHRFIERLNDQKTELYIQNQQLEAQQQQLLITLDELKEAQTQLVQSEKMASLGLLTAGIAHEINTPLGAINSNTDMIGMLLEKMEETGGMGGESAGLLSKMKKANDTNIMAVARIMEIVRTLKNFSRLDQAEFQEADLHQGIESVLLLVQHLLRHNITVTREYGDIPRIECYPNQLNQVFMNIVVNAAQSIEKEGEIKIKTGTRGDSVYVEIADNGRGIPPQNVGRIFDPGFTTKGVGVGTGLGLSICYNIVKKHGGAIEVKSDPGRGSLFRIVLPVRQPGRA